jgi:4a-hydroxytetrahydrobiopterin dehydratase
VDLPDGYALVNSALERAFRFKDFAQALDFVNRIGELAEREGHHPDIEIHWNKVTLRWWTHVADAVTDRDYELAAKSNELIQ